MSLQTDHTALDVDSRALLHSRHPLAPLCHFWGHPVSVAAVEQKVRELPRINECFIFLQPKAEINPKIFVLVEMADGEDVRREAEIAKQVFISKGPHDLMREVQTVVQRHTTSFLGLQKVG